MKQMHAQEVQKFQMTINDMKRVEAGVQRDKDMHATRTDVGKWVNEQ